MEERKNKIKRRTKVIIIGMSGDVVSLLVSHTSYTSRLLDFRSGDIWLSFCHIFFSIFGVKEFLGFYFLLCCFSGGEKKSLQGGWKGASERQPENGKKMKRNWKETNNSDSEASTYWLSFGLHNTQSLSWPNARPMAS